MEIENRLRTWSMSRRRTAPPLELPSGALRRDQAMISAPVKERIEAIAARNANKGFVLLPALELGIRSRDLVGGTSRRGNIRANAWVTERSAPGLAWCSLHFAEACANALTTDRFDPVTDTPECGGKRPNEPTLQRDSVAWIIRRFRAYLQIYCSR